MNRLRFSETANSVVRSPTRQSAKKQYPVKDETNESDPDEDSQYLAQGIERSGLIFIRQIVWRYLLHTLRTLVAPGISNADQVVPVAIVTGTWDAALFSPFKNARETFTRVSKKPSVWMT